MWGPALLRPRPGGRLPGVTARETLARDARVIALLSSGHFLSHFFQLALPPLFPILKDELGVGYVGLGLVMSVFYVASGVAQTVSGFLVDHFGARRVLLGGVTLLSGSMALVGCAGSYATMLPLMALAGLGNSVFHPADFAIFNASIARGRLGRAYGVHGVSGNLGSVLGPLVVVGLTALFGWRAALLITGVGGLGVAVLLAGQGRLLADHRAETAEAGVRPGLAGDVRLLLATPIVMAFAYFTLSATSTSGLHTFSVSALVAIYETSLALATGALTAYLLGNAAGILLGGIVADRTSRHDLVASAGMFLGAVLAASIGTGAPAAAAVPVLMALIGFCKGGTAPSRDLLVRAASPVRASGKVFGFVYSGLDLGAAVTPLVFGWLLDRGEPRMIFTVAAGLMLVTIVTLLQVRRASLPAPAREGA